MSAQTNHAASISFFRVVASVIAIFTWGLFEIGGMRMPFTPSLVTALLVVGLVGLFDVLINDVLPARFHWRTVERNRHYVLAAMAFCYMAQLFVAFSAVRESGLFYYYLLNAFALMAVATVDATQRSRCEKWSTNCRN